MEQHYSLKNSIRESIFREDLYLYNSSLGPEPAVLLPQVDVPRLHRLETRDGGPSLLLLLSL